MPRSRHADAPAHRARTRRARALSYGYTSLTDRVFVAILTVILARPLLALIRLPRGA